MSTSLETIPLTKKCSKCKIEKTLRQDFHLSKSTKHGRHSVCKECRIAIWAAYSDNGFVQKIEDQKHCSGCRQIKDKDAFYRRKVGPNGLYPYCKDCAKKASALRHHTINRPRRLRELMGISDA